MKLRFSPKKRSHYTNCRLIPKAVIQHDKNMINEFNQCLTQNYDHVMPLSTLFHGQLITWRSLCLQQLLFTDMIIKECRVSCHLRKRVTYLESLFCTQRDGSSSSLKDPVFCARGLPLNNWVYQESHIQRFTFSQIEIAFVKRCR